MARRNESPEDKRRRELVQGFLKDNPIKDPKIVGPSYRISGGQPSSTESHR